MEAGHFLAGVSGPGGVLAAGGGKAAGRVPPAAG